MSLSPNEKRSRRGFEVMQQSVPWDLDNISILAEIRKRGYLQTEKRHFSLVGWHLWLGKWKEEKFLKMCCFSIIYSGYKQHWTQLKKGDTRLSFFQKIFFWNLLKKNYYKKEKLFRTKYCTMTLLQIKLSTFVKQINTKLIWTVKKHEQFIKLKTEKRVQTLTSKKK